MKAVILAAGEGIRMRPLTLAKPKPLLEVSGKSLLEHLVEKFPPKITELIIVHGYLGDQIINFCGNKFLGRKITYVRQPEKKGTFHALSLVKEYLDDKEQFSVFFPDDLLDRQTIEKCLENNLAIIVKKVEDPKRFGVVTLNSDGSVKDIIEKPQNPISNLALGSGYVLNAKIFNYPPPPHPNGEHYLSLAIAGLAKDHKIFPVEAKFWFPIATPEDLKKAENLLLKN